MRLDVLVAGDVLSKDKNKLKNLKFARLAQLVEHPLDVGRVTGSSPVSRTVY